MKRAFTFLLLHQTLAFHGQCDVQTGLFFPVGINYCISGEPDYITASGLTQFWSGFEGESHAWVFTTTEGTILNWSDDIYSIDIGSAGPGNYHIYGMVWDSTMAGLELDNNLFSDLSGCFAITDTYHPLNGYSEEYIATTLTNSDPISFCVGDFSYDYIEEGTVTIAEGEQFLGRWIITDEDDTILFNLSGDYDDLYGYDFEFEEPGQYHLYYATSLSSFPGLSPGNSISDLEGCTSISNAIDILLEDCSTSIEENSGHAFRAYPNPVEDRLTLETKTSDPITLEIVDAQGRVVKRLHALPSNATLDIDLSALVRGTYLIRIMTAQNSTSQRLIKL